jgi:hypothetical protein
MVDCKTRFAGFFCAFPEPPPFRDGSMRGERTVSYESLFAETIYLRGHQGDRIDAYLARPFGAGPYPGVVVIHHMPGWDGPHKEIGRRFAHHGYVAIVPNLQFREGKATPEENSASIRAAGGMPDDRTMGDVQVVDGALPYVSRKVGVIGYCSGGRQAYLAACTLRGIDAVIACYGGGVVAKPEELSPRQPVAPIEFTKTCSVRCSACSASRTRAPRRPMRPRPKKRSRNSARPTSFTPTKTPGMHSSPSTVRSIACTRR